MDIYRYLWTAFGLVIGSFLNVCIYRLPRNESIVFPGSHCPSCGKAVRPYDNIPVLSYLWLRGKCRFCKKPISLQYPIVELLAGLAFYACAVEWSMTPPTFVNSLLLAAIIVLVFTDFHHQILPNVITLPGLLVGILLSRFQTVSFYGDAVSQRVAESISAMNADVVLPWVGSILGALVGGGVLLAMATAYKAVRKHEGLGMGDIKMMAMFGAFAGWPLAGLTIFIGAFLGSIVGIGLMIFGGQSLQTKLPFGVFLGAAAALSLFSGLAIINWYLPS